ncbi:MAG: phosphoribosyltransferase [Ilumatobacter sp.]|nr:phosphoribosyltransferase [Ilumatobacter sp.]
MERAVGSRSGDRADGDGRGRRRRCRWRPLRSLRQIGRLKVAPAARVARRPGSVNGRKEHRDVFSDRRDAGRRLAARLQHLRGTPGLVVLGLPRGGVPVAAEVAASLHAPLDVIVVRKLGVPRQPELAMGAIGEDVRVVNDRVVELAGVTETELAAVERLERTELERRTKRFRGDREPIELSGAVTVLVDDGIATGSTARAACDVARAAGAARVVLAVPVAPRQWQRQLVGVADECVAVETPADFRAVGEWYRDFAQTNDDEVVRILAQAAEG